MKVVLYCPVCRARFRGARLCSRCGADLKPVMLLAAEAWRLREEARRSLEAGEFRRAHQFALEAQRMHSTSRGEALRLLSGLLSGVGQQTAC